VVVRHQPSPRIKMEELNYMGIDSDGRFVCVISSKRPAQEIAKEVGRWIRWGLSIERCDDEYVRQHFGSIVRPKEIGD